LYDFDAAGRPRRARPSSGVEGDDARPLGDDLALALGVVVRFFGEGMSGFYLRY
jgi:hypothetical protein